MCIRTKSSQKNKQLKNNIQVNCLLLVVMQKTGKKEFFMNTQESGT